MTKPEIVKTAIQYALVPITLMLILFLINLSLTNIEPSRYKQVVQDAVDSGTLIKEVHLPLAPEKKVFQFQGNDCLILDMLLMPRESQLKAALSPRFHSRQNHQTNLSEQSYPKSPPCTTLSQTMTAIQLGSESSPAEAKHYHRYIHGDTTVAALLLSITSLSTASQSLYTIHLSLTTIIFLLSASSLLFARENKFRNSCFTGISIVIGLFYASPVFDHSFSFAPTDIVITAFILLSLTAPLGKLDQTRFILITSAYGSLLSIFEFMTGGLPLGLAVLVTMVTLGNTQNKEMLIHRVLTGSSSLLCAVAICFGMKLLAAYLVWGHEGLGDFWNALGNRLTGDVTSHLPDSVIKTIKSIGLDPQLFDTNTLARIALGASMVIYSSFILGLGSHIVGFLIIFTSTAFMFLIAYSTIMGEKPLPIRRDEAVSLCLAGIIPIAWYSVFSNHTALHSYFMVRIMTWNMALTLIYVLALRYRPLNIN